MNTPLWSTALVAAVTAAVAVCLHAADKPAAVAANISWRFDGNGHFPDIHPPSAWGKGKNVLWQTAVEAGGYSSPIVAKDKVFVTAEMGSLICLDLADGKILWQKDLFGEDSPDIPPELSARLMRGCGGESKQSTPTPTSNGELVFYLNAMGLCACYDLQGKQQWIRIVETAEEEAHFTSSPIFAGDKIILSWGCLLALDAKDGHTLWKATAAESTYGTPVLTDIGGEAVAITPGGDFVRLADGEILCAGQFKSSYTTPLVENGIVYVIDVQAKALRLPAKAEKGMGLQALWNTALSGEFMASPIYRDGLIHTIENKHSRLFTIDATSGELLTRTRVADDPTKDAKVEPGVKIDGLARAWYAHASPVAAGDSGFFFDDAGNAAVLELGRESHPIRVNQLEDGCAGTPFFIGKKIIIRGSKTVYCIGENP